MDSLGLGVNAQSDHRAIVLAHVEADYLLPLTYPSNIEVKMYADQPGKSSLNTHYEIVDLDDPSKVYLKSSAVLVWFDLELQKSMMENAI